MLIPGPHLLTSFSAVSLSGWVSVGAIFTLTLATNMALSIAWNLFQKYISPFFGLDFHGFACKIQHCKCCWIILLWLCFFQRLEFTPQITGSGNVGSMQYPDYEGCLNHCSAVLIFPMWLFLPLTHACLEWQLCLQSFSAVNFWTPPNIWKLGEMSSVKAFHWSTWLGCILSCSIRILRWKGATRGGREREIMSSCWLQCSQSELKRSNLYFYPELK